MPVARALGDLAGRRYVASRDRRRETRVLGTRYRRGERRTLPTPYAYGATSHGRVADHTVDTNGCVIGLVLSNCAGKMRGLHQWRGDPSHVRASRLVTRS